MDISALDKALSTLESQISGVEQYVDGLEKWLWISSFAVIVGVAFEVYFVIYQYSEDRNDWRRGLVTPPARPSRRILAGEIASIILVVLGIAGELGVGILSSNANGKLRTLNNSRLGLVRQKAADAITQAGDAELSAKQAAEAADNAKVDAGKAKGTASAADSLARGARNEADSFEKDIKAATRDALESKALLTDARQLAAEAQKRAAEATAGVNVLKRARSLTNVANLVIAQKQFPNTEYTFSAVFADSESIDLLKSIDDVLQHQAGWKRTKPPIGGPAISVYGTDQYFPVPAALTDGIRIEVESPDAPFANNIPLDKLPTHVRAAVLLNLALSSSVSPPEKAISALGEPHPVSAVKGESKVIRISVGKKPLEP